MINFQASMLTWENKIYHRDSYYKYDGGFVGSPGDIYHVRFNTQSSCVVRDPTNGADTEIFLGSPCRAEYTIAYTKLFQVPSNEFRMAFSRQNEIKISNQPSSAKENLPLNSLSKKGVEYSFDKRLYGEYEKLDQVREVIQATLAGDFLNAESTYNDSKSGLSVTLQFPVNLINLNDLGNEFQVCTGPILVPDLSSWNGSDISRSFLAHVALSSFDHVEFILRREVDVSDAEKSLIESPKGLDRNELVDPMNEPEGYPPKRWQATTYNEVWELESENVFYRSANPK